MSVRYNHISQLIDLRKEMSDTKPVQTQNVHDLDSLDSFSQNQSQFRLPSNKNRYISLSKNAKKQRKRRNRLIFNQSTWTLEENVLYKQFLKKNQNLFESDQRRFRKLMKVNVLMSQYVKTRSSDQCHSHHQKMMINHSDVSSVIRSIQNQQNGVERRIMERRQILLSQKETIAVQAFETSKDVVIRFERLYIGQLIIMGVCGGGCLA